MAPQLSHAGSRFLARGTPVPGEAAAGDHLQAEYHLWLVGHQLEHGRRALARPVHLPAREPVALELRRLAVRAAVFWPLDALFGHVRAWNLFLLLTYLAAAVRATSGCGSSLCRPRRGARRRARLRARALRVAQSAGHLRGPISALLPLSLWALERGRRGSPWWLFGAGAALASIPFSDVHLALGAIPFFLLYALCRGALARRCARGRAGAGRGPARRPLLDERIGSSGRSLREVSALLGDRPRLRHAPPAARARELRLPRLAGAAARARRAGRARPRAPLVARRRAGDRGAGADAARARDALPALLDALASLPAAALPARAGAADAGRLPRPRRARRLRGGPAALGARRRAARSGRGRPARLGLPGGGRRARPAAPTRG